VKNLIVLFVLNISFTIVGQTIKIDTLFAMPDSSYSRHFRVEGKKIIVATSKNGLVTYNQMTKKSKSILSESVWGELRDIVKWRNTIYTITSGDCGILSTKAKDLLNLKDVFVDDISCINNNMVILGDPLKMSSSFYFKIFDLKRQRIKDSILIPSNTNEACYAGSGTTGEFLNDSIYVFVSGGGNSARFHTVNIFSKTYVSTNLPLQIGDGAGPFSIKLINLTNFIVVGGNYSNPSRSDSTVCFSEDSGQTWKLGVNQLNGYRCSISGDNKLLIACGTTGVDISFDKGMTWKNFLQCATFHSVLTKKYLYVSTTNGQILKIKRKDLDYFAN
jgi:hypothetical protein